MSLKSKATASIAAVCLMAAASSAQSPAATVRVLVETELGAIVLELDPAHAPLTTANFLGYVDDGSYNGGTFHRTVTLANQPDNDVKIEVIQAGVSEANANKSLGPIALERTSVTGLRHLDGTVSMARTGADSATSGWFICINDQASLDFGGKRNPDGQGFAAFGRVVSGMDVVRRIQQAPHDGQRLTPPIGILRISRVP